MVSNSTSIRPTLTRDEAGRLLGQTMGSVTAGAFALGAYLGRNSPAAVGLRGQR